jgi:hypothetical protein
VIEHGEGSDFAPATVAALYRDGARWRPVDDLSRIGAMPARANPTEGWGLRAECLAASAHSALSPVRMPRAEEQERGGVRTNTATERLRAGETVRGAFLYLPSVGVAPIVRAPRRAPGASPRHFDVGPLGLHVPAPGCA